jgi:hypothetical protein
MLTAFTRFLLQGLLCVVVVVVVVHVVVVVVVVFVVVVVSDPFCSDNKHDVYVIGNTLSSKLAN